MQNTNTKFHRVSTLNNRAASDMSFAASDISVSMTNLGWWWWRTPLGGGSGGMFS